MVDWRSQTATEVLAGLGRQLVEMRLGLIAQPEPVHRAGAELEQP